MTQALSGRKVNSARISAAGKRDDRHGLIAWAVYGWANAPFTTLIITFIFPTYFGRAVVGDEVRGQELWGLGVGLSGVIIAALSPLLGAISDAGGRRKPWLLAFTCVCVLASVLLWFILPQPAFVGWALALVGIANVGFGFGIVFSNAMLPELVPENRLGRCSGWSWALGYAGGLAALVLALSGFVQAEPSWLSLDVDQAQPIRAVGPLVGLWFALFALPLFVYTPDRPRADLGALEAVEHGFSALRSTITDLRKHKNVARFLLAQMFYADGLFAIFAFGGVYAAGAFGMSLAQVTSFGILLNVTAGLGAFLFAWVDDWIGSRRTVLIALSGLIIAATTAMLVDKPMWFWIAGAALGLFVGPPQAASRSLMARLAPAGRETEFFGLFALSGRATAFLGPLVVALVTAETGSQRLGLGSLLAFFVIGVTLLLGVKEPGRCGATSKQDRPRG
jgi:UMF1 family MFS transporter